MSRTLAVTAGLILALLVGIGCRHDRLYPREPVVRALDAVPPPVPATFGRPAREILALSGGGSYGAFSAGVLAGWSRANTRPEFDVVTGVSTGALIAPLAFLGPDFDTLMRRFYTEVNQTDILTNRYWATLPFSVSLATAQPLRDILEYSITPEVVTRIHQEHERGRRLYVATTQLDTRETVVWDLGEIAGRPSGREQIINILLASCAVPGVFPPVRLPGTDGHSLHADGGITAPVFVPPAVLAHAVPGANVSVIVAGKMFPDHTPIQPRVLKVLGASCAALMHAMTRREVANLYHMAQLQQHKLHLASLRLDFPIKDSGIEFDTRSMNRLYIEGVKVGLGGPKWNDADIEQGAGSNPATIRTGVP